jgi:uncharacterized protein
MRLLKQPPAAARERAEVADFSSSDLNTPLGQAQPGAEEARARRVTLVKRAAMGLAALPFVVIGGAVLYAAFAPDGDKGMPAATAMIQPAAPRAQTAAAPEPQAAAATQDQPARTSSTAEQMETDAGVRVIRPGSEAPGSVVIRVPEPAGVRLAAAPDRRLAERSRFGMLPKIGDDGARASQVYARPLNPQQQSAPARIAVLVGGLGISNAATADAISRLPADISFAFAPYGGELERQVQRARADGHEVFLQVPMEPFDYPDNDPGPHTLTAAAQPEENLDKLRWVLGRFSGYVGVVNFMGARFASEERAYSPVLRELAQRGLMVVDDGSSGRSQLAQAAAGFRAPALRADGVIDAVQRPDAIDRELARLEGVARERGFALVSASAFPVTIERLQRWSRGLEQRGIRLVPVSAGAAGRGQITGAVR